jgi:hypothetical protein
VSQMPDVAGSWPEEGTQYLSGAPMEPVQQPYPQQAQYQQQQQPYPQQGYGEQQQYGQPEYGAPQQQYPAQPSYPQQQGSYQEQAVQQQPMYAEEEQAAVPSEFDHLFRDSSPGDRRSITGRAPVVSGPGAAASPGFPQQQGQPAPQQAQAAQGTAVYNPGQAPQGFEERAPEYGGDQFYGGGGGYGQGGPGGPGPGRRRTPLLIGGAVVVVAAVGLYLGLSGGGSSSGGTPKAAGPTVSASHTSNETAQQQASAVWALVQRSEQLRSDINAEVGDLNQCSNVSSLPSEISSTASARQAQADQVAKLDVSKISNGAELVSELKAAWSESAESDNDYAKVATDVAGGCSKSAVRSDPNESGAGQASDHASSDKYRAAQLWNQTMPSYGQQQISESDL